MCTSTVQFETHQSSCDPVHSGRGRGWVATLCPRHPYFRGRDSWRHASFRLVCNRIPSPDDGGTIIGGYARFLRLNDPTKHIPNNNETTRRGWGDTTAKVAPTILLSFVHTLMRILQHNARGWTTTATNPPRGPPVGQRIVLTGNKMHAKHPGYCETIARVRQFGRASHRARLTKNDQVHKAPSILGKVHGTIFFRPKQALCCGFLLGTLPIPAGQPAAPIHTMGFTARLWRDEAPSKLKICSHGPSQTRSLARAYHKRSALTASSTHRRCEEIK